MGRVISVYLCSLKCLLKKEKGKKETLVLQAKLTAEKSRV